MSVITARRQRNIKIFKNTTKNELIYLRKKSIYKNLNLSFYYRTKNYYHYLSLLKKNFLTLLRLQCLVSNWNRSRYKFFGLNRIALRNYAHLSYLTGLQKSSW